MVPGQMDKGGSETGSQSAVTVGVQTSPYSQGTHCLPTAEGTPQEEPERPGTAGANRDPTAHCPPSLIPSQNPSSGKPQIFWV